MLQCNDCVRSCSPNAQILASREPCSKFQKDHFFFDFADHISKFTISNPQNEAVEYFLKHAGFRENR